MIKKLIVKNWKSHKSSEFLFSEGTNVLIGIMGSGKSSVMDAITFALFGTFPALAQRKIKIEDVVLRGESNAYVELVFEMENQDFTIKRYIEKGRTSTSELFQGSTLLESPQSSKVTENIENIIKMDYDLFVRAIYAEQNAIDYFLTIPRGQRMKKIDTLLKLDKFEVARSSANTLLNKLKDEKKTKMLLLERFEMSDTVKSYDRLKKETKEVRDKISDFEKQSIILLKEVNDIKKEIEYLEEQEKRKQDVDRKAIMIKTSIDELEKRSSEISKELNNILLLTDPEELKRLYEKSKEAKEKLEKSLKQAEIDLSTLKTRLDIQKTMDTEISQRLTGRDLIEKEISALGNIEGIKSSLIQKSIELDNEKRILFTSKSEIEHQRQHIQKLNKDGCPVCEREVGEDLYEKIKSRKESKISDLENIVLASSKKISNLENDVKSLDMKKTRLELLTQKYKSFEDDDKKQAEIRKALKDLSNDIPILEQTVKSLSIDYKKAQKENEDLESKVTELKTIDQKKSELSKLRERLELLYSDKKAAESSQVSFDHDILKNARTRYEKSLSQKATIESQLMSEKRLLQERQERLESIESQKNTIETLKQEINNLESYHKQIKLFSEKVEAVQSRLRQEFVKTVNIVMSEIWREFYPYQDYTDIRLSIEEGDYVLELKSGQWLGVEGVASGGERSSAALVLRIALALVLAPNLRWLILDEPTHNLDSNAIEQLSTILRHKIGEFVDQVFLITHEPRLEDAVSGYLYRLDRLDNKRNPTQIQKIDVLGD